MKSRIINSGSNKAINYSKIAPAKLKQYYEVLFDNKLKMNYTNTTINERELFIMNHKGWLYGTLYDDFASADHLMFRFTFRNPKGLILGDLSKTDFLYNYKNDKRNYYLGLKLFNINNENLIARQEMMEYFKSDFQTSLMYFKQNSDYICAYADFKNQAKIFDPNLSTAYYACYHDDIKLFYGGSPKILLEEDLAVNMDLEQLQRIYVQSLDKYKALAKYDCFNPCLNLVDFSLHFKEVVQATHAEALFEKKCQYSASVFRKIHEIYNENIFLMPNNLVDLTYSYAVDSLCPDFNKIFRNRQFIKKVGETDSSEKNFEEIMEKLVIINLLSHDEFKNFLYSGVNPLQELFLGLFKDYSLEKVLETYKKYYFIYCEPLMEIFTEDLKRIETFETGGRSLMKIYDQEIKEIQSEDRNEILVDKYTLQQHMFFGTQLLMLQINNNIRKRELKGENLISTKLALKKLLVNGIETQQTLDVYNELIAEANAQLKIFKLPKSFRKFEKKVKEALLDNHREMLGENFEETCFEAMKKVQQDMLELNMEQRVIKTGAEPELTVAELKSIKKNKDFFQQSKLIEKILESNKFENIKKLREQNYEYIDGKAKRVKDVSVKDIENEIYRLRYKLGIESKEDYYLDEEGKEPNMELLEKKVEQMKSEKFKSITNFSEFNKESENEDENENVTEKDIDLKSENNFEKSTKKGDGEAFETKTQNDKKNSDFFSKKSRNTSSETALQSHLESEDLKALRRLEMIRDLKMGFHEELENSLESSDLSELNPASYFDLDIFKGRSLEELKNFEIEELHEAETRVNSDGAMQMNEVQVGDSFYKYAQANTLKNSSVIDLNEQQAEANFQSAYSAIKEELVRKDRQRAERIINALESGQYLDDPFYIGLLMQSNRYLHIRERFLKKYYSQGNAQNNNNGVEGQANKQNKHFADLILGKKNNRNLKTPHEDLFTVKTPLLDKYINMPGDIVDNMLNDGVFEKYESDVGKVYVNLLKNLVDDIDAEEGVNEKDINLEEYEDSALKDVEGNDSSFNIYELENKIFQENDEAYLTKEEIEKELGWKKVTGREVSNKNNRINDGQDSFMLGNNPNTVIGSAGKISKNKNNEEYKDRLSAGNVTVNSSGEYVPGSKRGDGKKKAKKILNK